MTTLRPQSRLRLAIPSFHKVDTNQTFFDCFSVFFYVYFSFFVSPEEFKRGHRQTTGISEGLPGVGPDLGVKPEFQKKTGRNAVFGQRAGTHERCTLSYIHLVLVGPVSHTVFLFLSLCTCVGVFVSLSHRTAPRGSSRCTTPRASTTSTPSPLWLLRARNPTDWCGRVCLSACVCALLLRLRECTCLVKKR